MERRDRLLLRLQYCVGRLTAVIVVPILFLAMRLWGYRIRDLERVRGEFARLQKEHGGPWIICPNHLTMIDSALISVGLLSLGSHIRNFRWVPWNLPERDNFSSNFVLAFVCYVTKCLPVNRGGNREALHRVLAKCCALLNDGQNLVIFPEGGRSRTGRIERENFSYGVGRFLDECPECKVMLVYLRGDSQETFGSMPRFGERFHMGVEVLDCPRLEGSGLRRQREYARLIVDRLAGMEDEYFARRGK